MSVLIRNKYVCAHSHKLISINIATAKITHCTKTHDNGNNWNNKDGQKIAKMAKRSNWSGRYHVMEKIEVDMPFGKENR